MIDDYLLARAGDAPVLIKWKDILRDPPYVKDRNGDVWEKQDDESYRHESNAGTLGSLEWLVRKYGPLTPPPEVTS